MDFADFPPYTINVPILSLYFRYFVVGKAMEAEKLYWLSIGPRVNRKYCRRLHAGTRAVVSWLVRSPWPGTLCCVLGRDTHSASLYPMYKWVPANLLAEGSPAMD